MINDKPLVIFRNTVQSEATSNIRLGLKYLTNILTVLCKIVFFTQIYIIDLGCTKNTNITTKLKWKLFTKVIKRPSNEAWIG